MMKWVIAFEDFSVPHLGSALAITLRNVFVYFNLESKIMSITLDNASNNTSAIAVPTINDIKESFKIMLKDDVPTRWNSTYHMFRSGLKQSSTLMYFYDLLASKGSERVLSIRRTRLTPTFLEMCISLKDHLDAQERKQDKSTLETPVDFEEEILDAAMQENKSIPVSNEEISFDAASSECSISGPGSGGEEATDYGYNVYHDDY
uniref:Zinc finger BED domain-containing protein RICESLEEPER 2 n=1 Tax=Tanacetum cinerariifolium TaxID=118510 RepID=A0A6L2JJC2_TANCI|nr:zinc finger BED domain-containing protein RICESLEEPER 2 [Tanacetum cinerariifolium]